MPRPAWTAHLPYPANAPAARVMAEPKKKKEAAPPQTANLNNAATLEMVTRALEETAGNWAEAARRLGMDRSNLHHMAHRLGRPAR